MNSFRINSYHSGEDSGDEEYGINLYIVVTDPQGIDIESVKMKSPDDNVFILIDDGHHCDDRANDGVYGMCGGQIKLSSCSFNR